MKRKVIFLLCLTMVIMMITGCSTTEIEETKTGELKTVEFCFREGTPALTVAKLMKEDINIDESIEINYEVQKTPDLLVTKILKEEADIAIVPSNLAAQAYNKGLSYKLMGTSSWGTIFLAGMEEIDTIEDLKGKEIYAFGKGLTPDLALRYVLSQNGIDPDEDLTINYLNSAGDVGPIFISGKADIALLAEPLVTNVIMKKEDTKIIFDLNKEWSKITGTDEGFPQASLIIKSDLIEEDRDFVEKFLDTYESSIKWVKENPDIAGGYMEELELGMTEQIVTKAIDRINIGSFPIEGSREEYKIYFEAIMDFAPDFIGGNIPGEEIYFER